MHVVTAPFFFFMTSLCMLCGYEEQPTGGSMGEVGSVLASAVLTATQ